MEGDDSRTERMTWDQLPLVMHVVVLLVATWVVSNLGWKNWLLVIGIIGYVVWVRASFSQACEARDQESLLTIFLYSKMQFVMERVSFLQIFKHVWDRDMRRNLFEEKKKINSKKVV